MSFLLSMLMWLSLITPVYGKNVTGIYQVNTDLNVYQKATSTSQVISKIKAGKIIGIDYIEGNYGLSDDVNGYINLSSCTFQTSEASLIAKTKAAQKAKQIVVVNALRGRYYKVSLWSKKATWQESLITTKAYIGRNGMKINRRRGDYTTPIGCFTFTYAFGTHQNPGTQLTYQKLNKKSYWYYGNNTYKESTHVLPGEYLMKSPQAYEYALFINFNEHAKVKKAGGAIFLHCYSRKPYTAGYVAMPRMLMKRYMKTIQPQAKIIMTPHLKDLAQY